MDQKIVHRLEAEIEESVSRLFARAGLRELPLLPSQQTLHLMAKAAVTVYETAVENQRKGPPKASP